jgi:hypothetical protein
MYLSFVAYSKEYKIFISDEKNTDSVQNGQKYNE